MGEVWIFPGITQWLSKNCFSLSLKILCGMLVSHNKLFWQQGPISYSVIFFVSAPFHSWLANLGHVSISGIVTMLLAHDGSVN